MAPCGRTLLLGLLGWDFFVGRNARVTYLGYSAAAGDMYLRTDTLEHYVVTSDGLERSLKPGCRYDLNYTVSYGRRKARRTRYVRAASLVDCPAERSALALDAAA